MFQRFSHSVLIILLFIDGEALLASEPISLKEAFQKAKQHEQGKALLGIEREKTSQLEAKDSQATAPFLPDLNASYSIQRQDDSVIANDDSKTAKLTLTQNVFNGFKDISSKKSARLNAGAQKLREEYRSSTLFMDVALSYFNLAKAQAEMTTLDETDKLIKMRYREVSDRIRIGRSRATEKMALDAQISLFNAQREKAKFDLVIAEENFQLWTGVGQGAVLTDADSKIRPPLPSFTEVSNSLEKRKDIVALKQETESFAEAVKVARAEIFPSVDLQGNYYLLRPEAQEKVKWDVGVSLTVPLFQGGEHRGKIWEAASRRQEKQLAYENTLLLSRNEIRVSYLQAQSLFAQASEYQSAVESSDKNYKALVKEYSLGLSSNLDVLQALNIYLDNYRSRNRVHFEYLAALWKLRILVDQTE